MDRRSISGTLFAAALTGGLAAMIGLTALQTGSPYFNALLYGGAAAIIVGLGGLLFMLVFQGKPKPESQAVVHSVKSKNQSGGITAHTVNLSPPDRVLSPSDKARLLATVQPGNQVEVEVPHNDREAEQLGGQIALFLRENGFEVSFASSMGRPFAQGIAIHSGAAFTNISVGPR